MSKWLKTDREDLFFEDTSVGRLKKKIWEASDEDISRILKDYGVPSPSELAKPGAYIQTTIRKNVVENRKKNDILFIPIGGTFTIDSDQAWNVINMINPKIAIPMHYKIGGLSLPITGIDQFLEKTTSKIMKVGNEIDIEQEDFPDELEVWTFTL